MKALLFGLLLLTPAASIAHPVDDMSINQKCDLHYENYYRVIGEMYKGKTLSEQYSLLDMVGTDSEATELAKNLTKAVYDNAPTNKNPAERALYQINVSEVIRDNCIEQYLNAKPSDIE